MEITKREGLTPPPARTVNQYRMPSTRSKLIDALKSLVTADQFIELVDETRTQREIATMMRSIASQINMKIVTRNDADEKTVRVWRK